MGLLSPTCHHVVSSPCSLPLPINLRQPAEQKQASFSLLCHSTSTRGLWTPAPSPPALQVCATAGWLFYTRLQTHLRSQTTPSSTSFPIVLPRWLPGPLPPPCSNPLPFTLHPSFWLLVSYEGWSVARGHKHAHKHLYSQAPPGKRWSTARIPSLSCAPYILYNVSSPFCLNWRVNVMKTCVCAAKA